MNPVLTADSVSKAFGKRKFMFGAESASVKALQNVSVRLAVGETLGIVGESGCGKTTLARILAGLLKPDHGQVRYFGTQSARSTGTVLHQPDGRLVQYLFQDPQSSLNPRMTIHESLAVPLHCLLHLPPNDIDKRMTVLLDQVGLSVNVLDRYPHEFSGGQAQRIGIARTLAAEPEVIVLDEPVSALDVSVQAQVLNLLAELQDRLGLSYIFISHDLSVVEVVSQRIVVLYQGKVVEEAPTEGLFSDPRHPYTRLLANSIPGAGKTITASKEPSELPDPRFPPPGCAFAARCAFASTRCHVEQPELIHNARGHAVACFHPLHN